MEKFRVKIEPEALADIRDIVHWYNLAQKGLGERFRKTVIGQINSLGKNPKIYAVRYRQIRCAIVKKFPYMVHFFVNEDNKTVEVMAVFSTSRNPKIWTERIDE